MRYEWPDGNRCAVVISFDVDAESGYVFREPRKAAQQLGEMEERAFGPRTGLPRLLRLLQNERLRATFFVPGYTLSRYTDRMREIQAAGHELGCHGNVHETLDQLDEHQETAILDQQLDLFQRYLGLRPLGYRSPSWELNVRTPGLLKRYGFLYDSSLMGDDVPYELPTPSGPLVELPVQWLLDDAPLYRHVYGATNAIADPERVIQMWSREFKGLYEENGLFCLTMHPWISGRASRVDALRELLAYIRTFEGVWWATCQEVADWAATGRRRRAP